MFTKLATISYLALNEYGQNPYILFFKLRFNITLQRTLGFSSGHLPSGFKSKIV